MPDDMYAGIEESPSLDEALDTQDADDTSTEDTAAPAGRSTDGDDDEVGRLRKENEEYKKRVSGSTKTYQELQRIQAEKDALAREIEAERQRKAFWKAQGVDADEIDRIVREKAGVPVSTPAMPAMQQPTMRPEEVRKALDQHIRQTVHASEWERSLEDFIEKNPTYDSQHWRTWFGVVASQRLEEEKAENAGRIITNPAKMVKYVAGVADKMRVAEAKKAQEQARQTRTKINQQGVVEGGSQKGRTMTPDEDEGWTDDDYMSLHNKHKANLKRRR